MWHILPRVFQAFKRSFTTETSNYDEEGMKWSRLTAAEYLNRCLGKSSESPLRAFLFHLDFGSHVWTLNHWRHFLEVFWFPPYYLHQYLCPPRMFVTWNISRIFSPFSDSRYILCLNNQYFYHLAFYPNDYRQWHDRGLLLHLSGLPHPAHYCFRR